MSRLVKFLELPLILIFCFLIYSQTAFGQKPETIEYPANISPWDWRFSLGVSSIAMPTDIVLETASLHWPLIRFAAVMGLPSNFVLDAKVSTEVVTNHFQLSGRWIYVFNEKLHADVGLGFAYFFGRLEQFEFDNKIHGWFTYPSVGIGYDFGSLTLTLRGTISFINSLTSTFGSVESSFRANKFNGFFYKVSMEQLFWKSTTVGLAFQMNYLKLYYPEWPLFPAFDRFYWIPEIQIWLTI